MRLVRVELLFFAVLSSCAIAAFGQEPAEQVCRRPAPGSIVPEPRDLRSRDGTLRVELTYRSSHDAQGRTRFCFLAADGSEAPTLRVSPGDWLIIALKNEAGILAGVAKSEAHAAHSRGLSNSTNPRVEVASVTDASTRPCAAGAMTPLSTNLHFHGLTVPAVCHQDDVLHTTIQPGDAPFEYHFQIPKDEPPGLYWYHPHVHGSTKAQVLGGASGALIIEGIERAKPALAGLRERVFVIRDQNLLNPDAVASAEPGTSIPPVVLDHDGDVMNNGTGTGRPAQDLSINFVPVPYPDYRPATISLKPGERQLWRVLNASAITYLNLQLLVRGEAQAVEIVAIDGVPLNDGGSAVRGSIWQNHLGVSPGGRIEFVVKGPPAGVAGALITRAVNTGAAGENDPTRPLANIIATPNAVEPASSLAQAPLALPPATLPWIGKVEPVRTRKLYFSEVPQDPRDPTSPTTFYLTVDGQTPKAFDPSVEIPNIVAGQGDVEDWIIENRSQELHDFHIHQAHFLLLEWFGLAVNEGFLRDTINVPYWDGENPVYPRIKLRMDFRDPNVVGLFPYHCHLLEHEDAGMMGLIRVEPRELQQSKAARE